MLKDDSGNRKRFEFCDYIALLGLVGGDKDHPIARLYHKHDIEFSDLFDKDLKFRMSSWETFINHDNRKVMLSLPIPRPADLNTEETE